MTAEPKFVPEDAVAIELDASVRASVRLIDSVGYMIPVSTVSMKMGRAPRHDPVVRSRGSHARRGGRWDTEGDP